MILKYYAEVPNIVEAIKYYKNIFNATVIKSGKDGHHGNIKLFNQINILLHVEHNHREKPGYHIIKFDDKEKDLFINTIKKLKSKKDIIINFDKYKAKWGTTFFEFVDKYGYTWVLEINSYE